MPKAVKKTLLAENHDEPTAGHSGIVAAARISARYYWPGMFRDIARYVRKYPSCHQYKLPQQALPGMMHASKNDNPWKSVNTDLVGPLARSGKDNVYLLVFQDRFTKWIQCKAIRKATANTVTKALFEEIIVRFGCLKTVITDNDT